MSAESFITWQLQDRTKYIHTEQKATLSYGLSQNCINIDNNGKINHYNSYYDIFISCSDVGDDKETFNDIMHDLIVVIQFV